MKQRLIDAEILKWALRTGYKLSKNECNSIDFVEQYIDATPEVKIKRGHWISYEDATGEGSNTYECSECGFVLQLMDGDPDDNEYYFCPHCGARLIDEDNEVAE